MKKNSRTLLILGAVLVLCIGAYIGVSVYNANEAQKAAGASAAAPIYGERGEPVGISYESGDKALSFSLENGTWYVADNKDFPLNQTSLTNIVSALTGLVPVRTIDIASPLSTYGLAQPKYTLSASDEAGNVFKLLIGDQNSGNYYVMTEGGDKIYTISSTLAGALKTDLMSMIVLDTLPALSEATIDVISLAAGPSSLTLDKHKNKDETYTWFIVNGTTYTAADEFVPREPLALSPEKYAANAVSGLSKAQFSSCVVFRPTTEEIKAFGLDAPLLTVTVDYTTTTGAGTLEQASTKGTVNLIIGAALADGSGYYARIPGSLQINVLPYDAVTPLIEALGALGAAG